MRRILVFVLLFIPLVPATGLEMTPDTLDNQVLFNGKLWRNTYSRVRGYPFLFSDDFLTGTVTIGGKTFEKVRIKYDIYNDELVALSDKGFIIQVNKEVVDAFSLRWQEKDFIFRKMDSDSLKNSGSYVNAAADGDVSLFVRYRKEILNLAVDNKYDQFNQSHRIYVLKNGEKQFVNSKKELLSLLNDRKQEIRSFINSNKLKVSRKNPESFKAVVEYYNDLKKN